MLDNYKIEPYSGEKNRGYKYMNCLYLCGLDSTAEYVLQYKCVIVEINLAAGSQMSLRMNKHTKLYNTTLQFIK